MTVLEVIKLSAEFLARKGVESPRLQVELLLSDVLQMPRLKLYLNFERTLSEPELERLRAMVKRRGEREPLQYILGNACFCGYDFVVNREVLIPRPETEQLAEKAWQFLEKSPRARTLDYGTGSGCLAVLLALKCPGAEIHALDFSKRALEVARQNAAKHSAAERVRFHLSNGFEALPAGTGFDLIVGNPPYIPSADIGHLQPEVQHHEPKSALDGGPDGMDFYRGLAAEGPAFLTPDGVILLEFGDGQEGSLKQIFSVPPWTLLSIEKDLSGRPRILIARRAKS